MINTADIVVSDTLNLVNGVVQSTDNTIQLGTGTGATGTLLRTNGYINGEFARWVNATVVPIEFPVGSSTTYFPATFTFTTITGGLLTVKKEAGIPGNNGLPLIDAPDSVHNSFIEGYWDVRATSGLLSTNYALDLEATGFNSYTITGGTRQLLRNNSASNWRVEGSHVTAAGSTIRRSGLTSLTAHFAVGDTSTCASTPPITAGITGMDTVCSNATAVAYSTVNVVGHSYLWEVVGGTQVSGGSTNSITVDWGSTAMTGSVSVIEIDGCAYGTQQILDIAIGPLPPGSITGLTTVEESTNGVAYSVPALSGYTYNWTITGGTQASGGTTNSITVNWGSATAGEVSVTATNGCGTSTAVNLPVDVTGILRSIATGNWNQATTWDCNCVPVLSDIAIIQAGHVVTLTNNSVIKTLTIEATG